MYQVPKFITKLFLDLFNKLLKAKGCCLAETQETFTMQHEYESKMNSSLVMSFRTTIFKTVQLAKRVFRESCRDRNFRYFCNIPTVSTTVAALSRPLIHWCFQNDRYKETHFDV